MRPALSEDVSMFHKASKRTGKKLGLQAVSGVVYTTHIQFAAELA